MDNSADTPAPAPEPAAAPLPEPAAAALPAPFQLPSGYEKQVIRFPARHGGPSLVLPRRRSPGVASEASMALVAASEETRRSFEKLVNSTRSPWGNTPEIAQAKVEEMQRLMLDLEAKLKEREHLVAELEAKLAERERDLAEAEALLNAREKVMEAAKRAANKSGGQPCSDEERSALQALKDELDRQEASVKEQKNFLAEREQFLEENENKLFSKMQEHQEREMQLEQLAEELSLREEKLTGKPRPAPKPKAPEEMDEFRE